MAPNEGDSELPGACWAEEPLVDSGRPLTDKHLILQLGSVGAGEMICILPNRGLGHTSFPIFLGIQGGSRCLACVETGEGPSLQLEDVNIEDLYKGGDQATCFTFFQRRSDPAFRLEAAV
eukprot:bmy_09034T0